MKFKKHDWTDKIFLTLNIIPMIAWMDFITILTLKKSNDISSESYEILINFFNDLVQKYKIEQDNNIKTIKYFFFSKFILPTIT